MLDVIERDRVTNLMLVPTMIQMVLDHPSMGPQRDLSSLQTVFYGASAITAKASRHAAHNPLALFRKVVTDDEVMASPALWPGVMTRLMACPPTCGSAAAILCSADFAAAHGLDRHVRIKAQAMTTDRPITFEARDMREVVGFSMAQAAAQKVYDAAGVAPRTSTSSSCTTASRTTNCSATNRSASARSAVRRVRSTALVGLGGACVVTLYERA